MSRTPVMPSFLVAFLTAGLAATAAPAAAQCPASETRYSIVDLGTLGGTLSVALDVDDAGRVVGGSCLTDAALCPLHPFRWEDGVMTDLGTLGGDSGLASGINVWGEITGQSDNDDDIRRAFLWVDGTMTELPTLGGRDGRGSSRRRRPCCSSPRPVGSSRCSAAPDRSL